MSKPGPWGAVPLVVALFASAGCVRATVREACASVPRVEAPEEAPVVIVGAGLTGLVAAWELKKAGIDALVLEQAPWPGGRVQTVRWPGGVTAEAHMEEFWARSPAVPLLEELGLIDRARDGKPAHSSVRLDGRIYPYRGGGDRDTYLRGIFDEAERAALLAWNDTASRLHRELEETFFRDRPLTPELLELQRISLAEWIHRQRLPRRVAEWIRVTVEPEMSVEWELVGALDGLDELRLFLDGPTRFGERNYHVAGGNDRFVRALAAKLAPWQVLTNARVTAVRQDERGVAVRLLQDGERFRTVRARWALVTVPVFALGRLQFEPPLPDEVQKAVKTTRFGAYVKIHVGVRPAGLRLTRVDGESPFVLLSDGPIGSLYDATADDPLPPEADRLLTLLVHGAHARRLAGMSADEVRRAAYEGLEALFPGISRHLTYCEIFSYPTAVAYWPVAEGRSRFDALAAALRRPHGRVFIGGDTTENSHSEGAVRAGLRMARDVAARERGVAGR